MSEPRLGRGALCAIGAAALAARLVAAWVTGAFAHPQLYEYDQIARSIVAGHGFAYVHLGGVTYYSFTAPLYPWICAAVYALTGGAVTGVLLLQMVAGAAHAMLTASLGSLVWNRRAGLAAGLLVAVHPGLVIYSSLKAHPLTFDALCVTLIVWQLIRLWRNPTWRAALASGLALGVGVLSRPTLAVFGPIGLGWLLLRPGARRIRLGQACLLAGVAGLVVLPWVARNIAVHHRFVFMQTTNWEVLWRGNNPYATGHSYITKDEIVFDRLPEEDKAQLRSLRDEHQQAAWFRDRALGFIREHPAAFVSLTLRKFGQFWWWSPQMGALYPAVWLRAYQLFYVAILLLAGVGVARTVGSGTSEQRAALVLILLGVLALSLLQSLHYVEGRHRWAVEPLLLALAGWGMAWIIRLLSDRSVAVSDRAPEPRPSPRSIIESPLP